MRVINHSVKSCGNAHAYCKECRPELKTVGVNKTHRVRVPGELEPRFWKFVNFDAPNGCWEWTGSLAKGYGQFKIQNKSMKAHRISWLLLKGVIPQGLSIDHLCKNTKCINPAHLQPVTNAENQRRIRPSDALRAHKSREFRQLGMIYSLYRYLRAVEDQKQKQVA